MSTKSLWSLIDSRLLEWGLGLALLLAGLFGVLFPILGATGPFDPMDTREVWLEGTTRVPDATTGGVVTLNGTHQAEVVIADPNLRQRLLLALPRITTSLLVILILVLLLRMARTLRGGDVFAPENARRLNIIGMTVLVLGCFGPPMEAFTTQLLVSGTPVAERVGFSLTVSAAPVLVAFLILALGEVFRRGAKLRADTEGLV
ncbi:DUF2975 domain-containing protein [Streptomyces lunaelactis]|uniref:DUF2975 domain-containing protein n=1 Tax=Streptomyces lunaelactis TaxID=1535768 RepID=A0A2R4T4C4_9ACTN|nr:DUF2975 domain-containing protein [Streptomyces lunaelactis]AVZ73956.1 DUF2975 domain-containing protein [Streptomyces lunaelactis]NUK86578.1 DUF2975 domain-containing protein [Streptomyces lunaelactis]